MMPIRPSSNALPARPLAPVAEAPAEQAPPPQQAQPAKSQRRHTWQAGLRPGAWLRNCLMPAQARADRLAEQTQGSGAPATGAVQSASSSAVLTPPSFDAAMESWIDAQTTRRAHYALNSTRRRPSHDEFVAQLATVAREMKKVHEGRTDELRLNALPAMELPGELGQLQGMRCLRLSRCDVRTLPDTLGELLQLKEIFLHHNERLGALPLSVSQMTELRTLQVIQGAITELPPLEGMLNLQNLSLMELPLGRLPDDIGKPPVLTSLRASNCRLTHIPPAIGEAAGLTHLILGNNPQLTSLPEEIGQLRNLVELDLKACSGLVRLPQSLGHLKNLSEVNLSDCTGLVELPDVLVQLAWQGKVVLPRHLHYMAMHAPYSEGWHAAAAREHEIVMGDKLRHLDNTDVDALVRFIETNNIPSHIIMQRGRERMASADSDAAKISINAKWPGLQAWARKYDDFTKKIVEKSELQMAAVEQALDDGELNSDLYRKKLASIQAEHNHLLYGIREQTHEETGEILAEAVPGRYHALARAWLGLSINATGSGSEPGAPSRS